jgi:hypothetical protein
MRWKRNNQSEKIHKSAIGTIFHPSNSNMALPVSHPDRCVAGQDEAEHIPAEDKTTQEVGVTLEHEVMSIRM